MSEEKALVDDPTELIGPKKLPTINEIRNESDSST